jgi:hypothetical protein
MTEKFQVSPVPLEEVRRLYELLEHELAEVFASGKPTEETIRALPRCHALADSIANNLEHARTDAERETMLTVLRALEQFIERTRGRAAMTDV